MSPAERALHERISRFSFDEGAEELSFARRLGRDNGWAHDYTTRVIEEYRRFAFLAMVAGHPVTPSDQVDQVWHLHLTYTRSYWDRFCGEVLERPLHHGPTRGGSAEAAKFEDLYVKTLRSYARLFGHAPPEDIWPPPAARFDSDLAFRRVDTRRYWMLPRPSLRSLKWAVLVSSSIAGGWILFALWRQASSLGTGSESPLASLSTAELGVGRIILLIAVIAFAIGLFFVGRCPGCQRIWSLRSTGRKDGLRREFRCKHCSRVVWKKRGSNGGCAGTGCSGCTGCGGCGGD